MLHSFADTGSGDSGASKVSTEEFSFSWLNSLISVGVATVAMLSYALLSGLVQVSTKHVYEIRR